MLLRIMKLALCVLEEKYAIQILWRLREHDEMYLLDLQRELGDHAPVNNTIVRKRIEALESIGLIHKRLEQRPPRRIYVRLTTKGRDITDDLERIENKLNMPRPVHN